ncbi:MAG: DUF1232 domain-containing protein [Dehalococcoidia bacterium]|nr:DUF1232 domain-containing protein [Dehalococcoidia bacterium]
MPSFEKMCPCRQKGKSLPTHPYILLQYPKHFGVGWLIGILRALISAWLIWRRPQTPRWLKVALVLAGVYGIWPLDFLPDMIPVLGGTDDVLVLSCAVSMLLAVGKKRANRKPTARQTQQVWKAIGAS